MPEWNDLVHKGKWKEAFESLKSTNNFPEWTGKVRLIDWFIDFILFFLFLLTTILIAALRFVPPLVKEPVFLE